MQSVTSSESEDKYAWAKGDGCVFFIFSHGGADVSSGSESETKPLPLDLEMLSRRSLVPRICLTGRQLNRVDLSVEVVEIV